MGTTPTVFSGTRTTFLGASSGYDASNPAVNNSTAVGYGAMITASRQIVLGTPAEYVYVAGTTDSTNAGSGALVVAGGAYIGGNVVTRGNTTIYGNTLLSGNLMVYANTIVYGNTLLMGNTVAGNVVVGNTVTGNLVVNSTALFRQVVSVVSEPTYKLASDSGIGTNAFYINYTSYPSTSSRCWLDVATNQPTGDVYLCIDQLPVSTLTKMNYRFNMVLNGSNFVKYVRVRAAGGGYQTPSLYCANGAIGSMTVGAATYVDQRIEIVVDTTGTVVMCYTDIAPLI